MSDLPKTITSRDARIAIYTLAINSMRSADFTADAALPEQVRTELQKASDALIAQLEENLRYYQRRVA